MFAIVDNFRTGFARKLVCNWKKFNLASSQKCVNMWVTCSCKTCFVRISVNLLIIAARMRTEVKTIWMYLWTCNYIWELHIKRILKIIIGEILGFTLIVKKKIKIKALSNVKPNNIALMK